MPKEGILLYSRNSKSNLLSTLVKYSILSWLNLTLYLCTSVYRRDPVEFVIF